MMTVYALFPEQLYVSAAVTVKENVSATVGVPLSTPDAESVRPSGNVPDVTENVYGDVPPLAVTILLYGVQTIPSASVLGATITGGHDIVIAYDMLPVQPFASVAVMVKELDPSAVGVPAKVPPEESVKPVGKLPLATAYV